LRKKPLIKPIGEFQKFVGIAGFGKVKIRETDDFLKKVNKEKPSDLEVQVFNADLVATWQHLYFAAVNALTAFSNRDNMSKTLAMEAMLYASAQRQIRKATEKLGIKRDTVNVAILVIGEKPASVKSFLARIPELIEAKEDETVLELTDDKIKKIQEAFAISDREIETVMKADNRREALTNLVIEEMALLAADH
jgi:tRNA threonylcarbamoyladenosine modification (KEOPS) complex Cgi121 subunit